MSALDQINFWRTPQNDVYIIDISCDQPFTLTLGHRCLLLPPVVQKRVEPGVEPGRSHADWHRQVIQSSQGFLGRKPSWEPRRVSCVMLVRGGGGGWWWWWRWWRRLLSLIIIAIIDIIIIIIYFLKLLLPYFVWLCTTVDGQWNQTPAVLLSPSHPQISMLPSGCALGAGGQKNQTVNAESNIEFWGLGFYLVGVCRVWFFCPSTVVSSLYTITLIYSCSVGGGGGGGGQGRGRWRRWRRWQ